jgi:hypothetical protein
MHQSRKKRVSRKQRAANRRNAQFSTGPRTLAGRQKVSRNAIRHGLAGNTVVVPGEDRDAYEIFRREMIEDLAPASADELSLAQTIADSWWRLNRVPGIENALFANGKLFEEAENLALLSLYEQRLYRKIHKNRARMCQIRAGLNQCQ